MKLLQVSLKVLKYWNVVAIITLKLITEIEQKANFISPMLFLTLDFYNFL